MNKREASTRLGVSTRLVEKYASEGRLGEIKYIRGKTGKQADYDPDAVEHLRVELETPDQRLTAPQSPVAGLVAASMAERLIQALEALRAATEKPRAPSTATLTGKVMLTEKEAAHCAGVPLAQIRRDRRDEKLPATKTGAGWRIHSSDLDLYLDAYVRKL
jgi:excisionase family DNA binding protein